MTEIPDLSALFGGGGPPPTEQQQAHIKFVQEFERDQMLERIATVMFLAPILCSCSPRYDRRDPVPPQVNCPIHGMLMMHPLTGAIVMPGMPVPAAMFTPKAGETHPQEGNDEEAR